MSDLLAFITWDVDWNIIESPLTVRYYGVLWALSFLVGIFLMKRMMANDNAPDNYTDKIFIYVLIGGVLGARLGHVIFYDPGYYFSAGHWTEIPMIWKGGLASHGGLIGVVIAIWLYSKFVTKRNFLWSADKVVVTVALAACLIRVGNLMNSEIIGRESDSPMAMFFEFAAEDDITNEILSITDNQIIPTKVEIADEEAQNNIAPVRIYVTSETGISKEKLESLLPTLKTIHAEGSQSFNAFEDHIKSVDDASLEIVQADGNNGFIQFGVEIIPRIPTQIWEAGCYLLIFLLLFWGYWKKHWYRKEGLLFGLFMTLLFGARFIIEFYKENQVEGITDDAMINRGQQLSIPAILIGVYFVYRALKNPEKDTKVTIESKEK